MQVRHRPMQLLILDVRPSGELSGHHSDAARELGLSHASRVHGRHYDGSGGYIELPLITTDGLSLLPLRGRGLLSVLRRFLSFTPQTLALACTGKCRLLRRSFVGWLRSALRRYVA